MKPCPFCLWYDNYKCNKKGKCPYEEDHAWTDEAAHLQREEDAAELDIGGDW